MGIALTSNHIREAINADPITYDFLLSDNMNDDLNTDDYSILQDLTEQNAPRLKKRQSSSDINTTTSAKQRKKKKHKSIDDRNIQITNTNQSSSSSKNTKSDILFNTDEFDKVPGNNFLDKAIEFVTASKSAGGSLIEDTDEYD